METQPQTTDPPTTPYVGLGGQNEGYDQPSDPPSYAQATNYKDNTGQYPGPPNIQATQAPPSFQPAYGQVYAGGPASHPVVNVTQQPVQPVHVNNVVVAAPIAAPLYVYHNSYLTWSILNCLFCFWPLGLVAIIFSCISRDDAMQGNLEQARHNARIAMWLNVASLLVACACYVALIIVAAAT